jgi:hypothetical protein
MVMVVAFSPKGPQQLEAMPERTREAKPFAQRATRGLHSARAAPRFGRMRRFYSLAKRGGSAAAF